VFAKRLLFDAAMDGGVDDNATWHLRCRFVLVRLGRRGVFETETAGHARQAAGV